MQQRLQKILAAAGIASRRRCEEIISAGRVKLNGVVVSAPGTLADADVDRIELDCKPLNHEPDKVYLAMNKPVGYFTTVKDKHAPRSVMQLLAGFSGRVYPVGRLDANSAGLLLFSNDGDFTYRLTHPKHQTPKTYRAVVRGEVSAFAAADLASGVVLEDGMTAPARVEFVEYQEEQNVTVVDITIHEGRNRQVRRMFASVGYPVLALTRIQIGPITLKGIAPGTWRKLRPQEVADLNLSAVPSSVSRPQCPIEEDIPAQQELREVTSRPARVKAAVVKPATKTPAKVPIDKIRAEAAELAALLGRDEKPDADEAPLAARRPKRRRDPITGRKSG